MQKIFGRKGAVRNLGLGVMGSQKGCSRSLSWVLGRVLSGLPQCGNIARFLRSE